MKRLNSALNSDEEKRNHSVQNRSKTQYADTVGRLPQKITSPGAKPGNHSTRQGPHCHRVAKHPSICEEEEKVRVGFSRMEAVGV